MSQQQTELCGNGGASIGQLLSATKGITSASAKRKMFDLIEQGSTSKMTLAKDQYDIQNIRELLHIMHGENPPVNLPIHNAQIRYC